MVKPERWKPVPNFDGLYEVSDHGRVRSIARYVSRVSGYGNNQLYIAEKILRPMGGRYPTVRLYRPDGTYKGHGIHKLVARCFVKRTDPTHDTVRHKDDNPKHNHYKNLEWGTQYDNIQDRNRRGRTQHGESSGHAKLTERDIRAIKKRCAKGEMQKTIAADYGIHPSHVSRINSGLKWAYLER